MTITLQRVASAHSLGGEQLDIYEEAAYIFEKRLKALSLAKSSQLREEKSQQAITAEQLYVEFETLKKRMTSETCIAFARISYVRILVNS